MFAFDAYPNPVNNVLTLAIEDATSASTQGLPYQHPVKALVVNMVGSTILETEILESSVLDLSNLPTGSYIISVLDEFTGESHTKVINKQ